MYYLDVPGLVEISDVIVAGEIVESDVFIGNHDRITTEWTVRVSASLKGSDVSEVKFRQWAGELNGRVMHIPGDGQFEVGQHVVLFLHGDSPDHLFLAAMGQSVFHVQSGYTPALGGTPVIELPTFAQPTGGEGTSFLPADSPVMRDFENIGILLRGDEEVGLVHHHPHYLALGHLLEQVRDAVEAGL
jgi:hypothetical protein